MAMRAPHIQATNVVVPMIYAYTTPEIARHDGWTKIGYTEQNVETRINQQTHTGDIRWQLEWKGNAVFDDGSGEAFSDKMFHAYLRKNGIEQEAGTVNEWFKISGSDSRQRFFDFRVTRGLDNDEHEIAEYHLRAEQEQAVSQAAAYLQAKQGTEFLWNAKPRFGKTLSVYDFAKRIGAEKVLVVTNRPAVANSWYRDYYDFIGPQSGYFFVSHVDEIAKCPGVMSYEAFAADKKARQSQIYDDATAMGIIYFASLQDLKGSVYFGGDYEKRREISTIKWDLLVIDEAHEGVDTYKTDAAFDRIARRFTLHLSGTPFKALANNKFPDNAIFNWTYADEQRSKRDWNDADGENPYANLPKLNLFTYQMSEIVRDELKKGIEIDGVNAEYAFDLNEFFRVDQKGQFVYNRSVDRFLDALATQTRFPFSTPELRAELKHTFWMLNRVESARALAKKLAEHPVFHEYHIVLAAGDGRIDDEDETRKAFDKVTEAIRTHEKTITLSVGQLSTGVTVPEWTAVLMLSNMKSPSLYMQAAFRAQNPCLFREGTAFKRKQNAYVFDFDPARTLTVFEEFANDLNADTASGKGDIETRERHIRELLNFFPVIGEDENSELIELNPEQVLTIPRKIRSVEVVKRGFMCNFLFQNISSIFSAPQAVVDIITHFQPQEEGKIKNSLQDDLKNDLSINKNGDIDLDDDILIGLADDMFGDKLFSDVVLTMENAAAEIASQDQVKDSDNKRLREMLTDTAVSGIVDTIEKTYGDDFKKGDKKQLQSQLEHKAEKLVNKVHGNFRTDVKVAEADRLTAMKNRYETGLTQEEIEAAFQKAKRAAVTKFEEEMKKGVEHFVEEASVDAVKQTETKKQNREKQSVEDTVRQHLRGFARTIPSFLMAYGDREITLENFDKIVPENVFREVTGIKLDEFTFLRDGGDYYDTETDSFQFFDGHLFDPVVFNDSIREFLNLRQKLADYFDEENKEDIFDYIPPQKTNQIFTPKKVVKQMVDLLEEENPGCFDEPNKTFIDLYMKSGLYIVEIVKRLFRSERMKQLFPDRTERLKHIFGKQVFGLAPTEIIYRIALRYILGFDEAFGNIDHNFKLCDALPFAKNGTLEQKLDELFEAQVD